MLQPATDIPVPQQAAGVQRVANLAGYAPSAEFVASIPIAFARRHAVLGMTAPDRGDRLVVVMSEISAWELAQVVARLLDRPVTPLLAPRDVILGAVNRAYEQRTGQAQAMVERLDRNEVLDELRRLGPGREDLLDNAARAPVVKLVNLILFEAVKSDASDVHVQPYEDRLLVRTRVDGVLYDSFTLPRSVQDEVVSRVKVMARMNIAEKRLPQDGRATVQVGDRVVDLRIASLPTSFGERVVIRLLDKGAGLLDLTELGMDERALAQFRKLITLEHGLVLVTGPTGSGKSTTLYAALRQLDCKERNILTLEDPIEYQLDGISQTQVSDKKGLTFAGGLRSVLRQDPDVIMVGEIRDAETATMAIQSSLTGHLVFSTLHTNDAASAVTRLLDLGIEPYLAASSVMGVLAQRLVRKVCANCARPYEPNDAERKWLGSAGGDLRAGAGCAACRQTGYRGRVGIFEMLPVDEAVRQLIQSRATASQVKDAAVRAGMRTLRDEGIGKVLAGVTTIAEVERVTHVPDDTE